MTHEKAIEQLQSLIDDRQSFISGEGDDIYRDDIHALKIAIICIEGDIPKAVETYPGRAGHYCPACDKGLSIKQDYCDGCGQALDWGRSENA